MNLLHIAKRNRIVAALILTAGAIAVLWIIWFIGATKYQSAVDHWIALGREAGYDISYDRREQFGFPRRTTLRFVNLHWKNTDGIEFHAGDLDISAEFWETQKFTAKFKGQIQLDVPIEGAPYALMVAGEDGKANVTLSDDGLWEQCSLTMNAARIGRSPDYLFTADHLKLAANRPADQPADNKSTGLTLSGDVENVTLPAAMPPSFGPKMPSLNVAMRLMGPVPDFRRKDSVAAWNKMNGVVEFDHLDMEWGALLMTSKGTMGLDDDLQPEGAFAAVVGRQDQLLETLAKDGYIHPEQEAMLNSALRLFAKPAAIKGESGIEVPVAVQLGGFFLGPVKIFAFPQIGWE